MKRVRSLSAQMNYCISESFCGGVSKRADRKNGVDLSARVYSVGTAENLRDTVKNICNFMKEKHPEIKLIKEIKAEHIQEWINERESKWSDRTLKEQISRVGKLSDIFNKIYGINTDWKIKTPERAKGHNIKKIREISMEKQDLLLLKDDLSQNGRSENALRAVEISSRCGLRSKEIARLRTDCIDIENKCLHIIEGAKNGKKRDVPIRKKDLSYFEDLKNTCMYFNNSEYVTEGISEDSLNRAIRRSLQRLNLDNKYKNTTIHSIRKTYATERYNEELKKTKDARKSWEKVQAELGHGDRFRKELFNTYIGNTP